MADRQSKLTQTKPNLLADEQRHSQAESRTPKWWRLTVIVLLTLGVLLRFSNLDLKPYWFDEASTSLQLAGSGETKAKQTLLTGQPIGVETLQKFQYPDAETTIADTTQGLAVKEPQLTPLYFWLARFWVTWLGDSVAVTRSLSAVFSVLALPCLYWLSREIFASSLTAWLAIGLAAVSPFYVLSAQEARPASLWLVTILLASVALLRALKRQTVLSWALYAGTIVIGLYTFLFTGLVMLAHGAYVAIMERFRVKKPLLGYLLASATGLIAFLPWVLFALIPYRSTMAGQSLPSSLPQLAKAWARNLSLFFCDFSLNETSPRLYFLAFLGLVLLIALVTGYALYTVWRTAPDPARWFILTLVIVPFGVLVLIDLLTGASRSSVARYLIPTYLGVQLAVAYCLSERLTSARFGPQRLGKLMLTGLLAIGLSSAIAYTQSPYWWNKDVANQERQFAQTQINPTDRPLIVSDAYFVESLSLSHSLSSNVQLQLVPTGTIPEIPSGFSDVFLFKPSPELVLGLRSRYALKPTDAKSFWRLSRQ